MSSRLSLMGYLQLTSYPEMLLSLASFLILIYFLQYWCFCRRSSSGTLIPTNWPLVGMIPSIFINRHDLSSYVAAVLKEAGGNFLFKGPWFAGMDTFATCDPANIKHILISNFPNYPKGPKYLEAFDAFGDGFVNSDGDLWAFQRRVGLAFMSSPKFWSNIRAVSLKKLAADNGLLAILNRVADENGVVDLCDVFARIFVDLAFIMVVGVDPGCLAPHLPDMALTRAVQDIQCVGFCRLVRPRFWWNLKRRFGLWEEKRLPQARKLLDDYLAQCVGKRQVEIIRNASSGSGAEDAVDLLSFYMETINRRQAADSPTTSDKFLSDTLLSFIIANRDGASVLLGWFFWLVSANPPAEKKIVEELRRSKLNSSNRSTSVFSADEVDKLVYLHAAINESLRLYPPVPYSGKLALNDDVLPSGDKVNAGQYVFISSYGIARMEGVWGDDCLEFRPERWIDEGTGELRREPSHKFVTFNSGPRSCLGKNMAMEWMKMAAAAVMYNFEVVVEEGHVAEPTSPSLLLQMKYGLRVRLKNRVWTP